MENEVAGLYLSGHPMMPYAACYQDRRISRTDRLLQEAEEQDGALVDGKTVTLAGIVGNLRETRTKTGAKMAYGRLEDLYGAIETVFFPKVYARFGALLQQDAPICLTGRLDLREDQPPQMLCERVEPLVLPEKSAAPAPQKPAVGSSAPRGLYLRVPGQDTPQYRQVLRLLAVFDGQEDVYIRFADTGRMVRMGEAYRTAVNPVLLSELSRLLSQENVAYSS